MVALTWALLLVACSSDDDAEPGDSILSESTTDSSAEFSVEDDGEFVIEAIEVTAIPGAPEWCTAVLSDSVRTLPSAVNALGEAEFADQVAAIFADAANTFRSELTEADLEVRTAGLQLADALEAADTKDPSSAGIDPLAEALDGFGMEAAECGFQ